MHAYDTRAQVDYNPLLLNATCRSSKCVSVCVMTLRRPRFRRCTRTASLSSCRDWILCLETRSLAAHRSTEAKWIARVNASRSASCESVYLTSLRSDAPNSTKITPRGQKRTSLHPLQLIASSCRYNLLNKRDRGLPDNWESETRSGAATIQTWRTLSYVLLLPPPRLDNFNTFTGKLSTRTSNCFVVHSLNGSRAIKSAARLVLFSRNCKSGVRTHLRLQLV
jgi:hypothetical protein